MKAAVVEKPGQIVVRDVPEPSFGDYEARCELLYGSVCAGTDTHLYHHHAPFCYWVNLPFILGHESVGKVTAVGSKVRNLKVGDLVTRVGSPGVEGVTSGWGGFAEVGVASDWQAMKDDGVAGWQDKTVQQVLPADVDPAAATLFITWRETLSYVQRMGISKGVTLLVIGSGGNGLAFAAHAKNLGATTIAMVGSANREEDARRAGVTEFFDYKNDDCWSKVEAVLPDGFDFVIDSVGRAEMTAAGQARLKAGGTIGIYGLDEAGKITLSPGKTFTFYNGGYDEAEAHKGVLEFYREGKLDPSIWHNLPKIFNLEEIGEALAAVADRSAIKPLIKLH